VSGFVGAPQVRDEVHGYRRVFAHYTDRDVAGDAEQAADDSCQMVVINGEPLRVLARATDCAEAVLRNEHRVIFV
jgi:hypothetical protein